MINFDAEQRFSLSGEYLWFEAILKIFSRVVFEIINVKGDRGVKNLSLKKAPFDFHNLKKTPPIVSKMTLNKRISNKG